MPPAAKRHSARRTICPGRRFTIIVMTIRMIMNMITDTITRMTTGTTMGTIMGMRMPIIPIHRLIIPMVPFP